MRLNGFLFVYEEKRGIPLVIFIIKLIIACILSVIICLFIFDAINFCKEEDIDGEVQKNEILILYWNNFSKIKTVFPTN